MGYNTRYELTLINPPEPAVGLKLAITQALLDLSKGFASFEEAVTWYTWEDDGKAVSAQYPDVLFAIDGNGEQPGDQWRCFFRGGKSEIHKMPQWVPPEVPTLI